MSWSVDGVPFVSQVKSGVLLLKGESGAALETQKNFSRRCIGVAQGRSAIEILTGNPEAALRTHHQFIDNAKRLFWRAGEVSDALPVVSQIKSAVHIADGDVESAWQTQMHFSQRCPVVSQVYSLAQTVVGDTSGAAETRKEFADVTMGYVDALPVVGHVKGLAQMRRDPAKGWSTFNKANSTIKSLTHAALDALSDVVSNSSGSGLTEAQSLEKWERQFARTGGRKFSGLEAAPAMVATNTLVNAHSGGCLICLRPFAEGELVRLLPCLHLFHGGGDPHGRGVCIDGWMLNGHLDCPACRKECTAFGDD